MSLHLYFSLIPEALIASMLPPEEFGQYYATGHKFKSKGQALFFEIDPTYRHEYFDIDGCYARCVPKASGAPKNSIYVLDVPRDGAPYGGRDGQAVPDHGDGRDAGFESRKRIAGGRA